MSLGRPNGSDFITPETYVSNQAKIEQARKLLEDMEKKNRVGLQRFTEREQQQKAAEMKLLKQKQELQKKIQEGLEAQRLIEELERQESTSLSGLTEIQTSDVGSARIEEVVQDNNQTMSSASPEIPATNFQVSNTMPPMQHQTLQQPQHYSNHPAQMHAYSSASGNTSATPIHSQYPPFHSFPNAYFDPRIQNQNQNAPMPSQQTYGSQTTPDYHTQAPLASWYPTQPSRDHIVASGSSQQASFSSVGPATSSLHSSQVQQHIPSIPVYQHTTGHPSNFNGVQRQTNTVPSGTIPPSNVTYYGASPSLINTTSSQAEQPPPSLLPPPQQVNSRFVDNFGVPYIALTDEQIFDMRRRLDNWRRQAPPGTIDKLHEMLYLHKDTAKEPITWIYVPSAPGSDRYARTAEIDKFFNIFLENARMARKTTAPRPIAPPTSNGQLAAKKTFEVPTAAKPIVLPQVQIQINPPLTSSVASSRNVEQHSASSSRLNLTPSTPPLVNAEPLPLSAPVRSPNKPPVTPSGLTRHLPLQSLVDKKHLSQNVLFALGKRSRASLTSADEKPAKKHAPDTVEIAKASSNVHESPSPVVQIGSTNLSKDLALPASAPDFPNQKSSTISSTSSLTQAVRVAPINDTRNHLGIQNNENMKPSQPSMTSVAPPITTTQMANPQQTHAASEYPVWPPTEALAATGSSSIVSGAQDKQTPSENSKLTIRIKGLRYGRPKSSGEQRVSSGSYNHVAQPAIARVDSAKGKSKDVLPQEASSLLSNPYAPLLSIKPSTTLDPTSTVASGSSPTQLQGQRAKTGTFPTASGSSQIGNFSYNDISLSLYPSHQTSYSKQSSSKQKTPLFLPSSSPERGPPLQVAVKSEESSLLKGGRKKKTMVYVQAPDAPDYLLRHRRRMAMPEGNQSDTEVTRKQFQRLRTGTSSVSTSVVGEEVSDVDSMVELRHKSSPGDPEQEAVHLACSRLQELSCRWNGCNVKLNSVNSLIRHLDQHKPTPSVNNRSFTCRWIHCGRRCNFDEKHLEKHPLLSLKCAYKDCDESYRSGSQLLKHYNAKHTTGELKPSAEISRSNVDTPPPVPGTLPAYLFITKMVKPATITPERHEVLCRWVVQNIVNSDQEKPARLRTRKTAKALNLPIVATGHDYEFITARSTRYSSYLSQAVDLPLEDLDSAGISRMVDAGLTLWYPEEDTSDDDDASTPTQPTGIVKVEAYDDAVLDVDATGPDYHIEEPNSDEDAVEDMLTEQ